MRDSSYMTSHPTGVPAGLPELTPVIVNQSPELASRRGYESQHYEEELHVKSQQMYGKQPTVMDHYGGLSAVAYRPRDQDHISPAHANAYLGHNQSNFANNAVPSSFANYQGPQESPVGHYSALQYGRVTSWQPQQGAPGTELRIMLLTQLRIDTSRQTIARFARENTAAACHGFNEQTAPFRYLITVHAPAQTVSQWSKPKSSIPLELVIPYEGTNGVAESVGTYNYIDTSAAASPSGSEIEQPRRQSTTPYDSESPRHSEFQTGQLPPIRPTQSVSNAYYPSSTYSASTASDDYTAQTTASSYYTPSLVSSFGQTPTPPTPSWPGVVASTAPLEAPTSAMLPMTSTPGAVVGALRSNPVFVRARNDQVAGIATQGLRPQGAPFNPYSMYPNHKANIQLIGNLNEMTKNWTAREKMDKRRLVQFSRTQEGSVIHANFEAVDPDQRQQNAAVVSCIWWEPENEFYVTSVDTISLLERLVTPDAQFTVEEKNRIRRNLEGFHPQTISKNKAETEAFFKQIMNFPMPRPRHIEKDVKVFKWQSLEVALRKIIGKYSASYASTSASGRAANRHLETAITAEPPAVRAPLPLPYSSYGNHQHMPMSATASNFSDGYAQNYSSYAQSQTPTYSNYAQQQQHQHQQYNGMQDSHMLMQQQQQHRPSAGFQTYLDNHNGFMS